MATNLKIPVLSIASSVSGISPVAPNLPWNGTTRPYKWSLTLSITTQNQSSVFTRARLKYNGEDVNVGQWIGSLTTGLAWQIISITSKTANTVNCIVQDVNRYNTYRAPAQNGLGAPASGSYVVFELAEDGTPLIDPIPVGAVQNFHSQLTTRFTYFNSLTDFTLNQPGLAGITFNYGDVIAIDEPTQTFVLADTAHSNTVIGSVTTVDETLTYFTINPIRNIVYDLDSLPGQVGDVIYVDNSNPGQLTTTLGGAAVYLKLRNNTQSTTTSAVFADTVTPITTVGNTFYVNGVLTSIAGSGIPLDVVNAINFTTSISGVSAILQSVPFVQILITAVDARAIGFVDAVGGGSTTLDAGLTSVENGIKAAGLVITGGAGNTIPVGLTNSYGYVFVQSSANATWNITHNGGTTNVSAQIYNSFSGANAAGNIILPDQISIVDINNITVTFGAPQSGTALLTIFL
jgi:hypothetical protein